MPNRDRHRQGLVYGPVRPSGPRDRGRIVGNLLGLLVVVVTVSVLALAIYFFVQARGTDSQPTATATNAPSTGGTSVPTISASAHGVATIGPSFGLVSAPPTGVAPSPIASDVPATPGPTLFVPTVMVGPGFVTFGTTADSQFHILDPKTTFGIDESMVWSAHLTEPASSSEMRIRILKLDATQPTGQALIREDEVKPDATAEIFFRHVRPLGIPGLFTIEYVRGDQILSEGSFLVQ